MFTLRFVCAWNLVFHIKRERRLTVTEKRLLWEMIGPMREEAGGAWRELHNEEFDNF
jgi:hypothetical protein